MWAGPVRRMDVTDSHRRPACPTKPRRYGLASHSTWSRIADPGETVAPEILGVDLWTDVEQMNAFYELRLGYEHLGPVFAGEPRTSVWQSAKGEWIEW